MEESLDSPSRNMKNVFNDDKRKKVRRHEECLIESDTNTTRPATGFNMISPSPNVSQYSSPSQTQMSLNVKNKRKVGDISPLPLKDITNAPTNPEFFGTTNLAELSQNVFTLQGKKTYYTVTQLQYVLQAKKAQNSQLNSTT
ncbi:hypothetical protein PIB30_080208 [Stylosanthes scabra]|uniref:Uncharacterized protein n=1 Tax=Stylosanthes scabra TaxID=79078 RepID=A0ABU6URE6_9FABA|nr:hypothetical protein [Stylosanthes scabra]